MFGVSSAASGLTFGKVISGITKTLGVANQIIPIYKEVKPVLSNAKSMFSIIKEFGGISKDLNNGTTSSTTKSTMVNNKSDNKPIFFQ